MRFLFCQVNYLPQQSCEGYVFTPVCLSTGGGNCLSACWDTTPPGPAPPRSRPPGPGTPREQEPLGSRHPPWEQTPLGADPPSPGAGFPPDTAAAADGTHPTGMHSCLILVPFPDHCKKVLPIGWCFWGYFEVNERHLYVFLG